MVPLRDLKRDIEGLSNVSEHLKELENSWLAHPKKDKRNKKKSALYSVFQELSNDDQKEIAGHLEVFHNDAKALEYAEHTNKKLHTLSSAMIEIKLAGLRGNEGGKRAKYLKNKINTDDFHSLSTVTNEVEEFHESLSLLQAKYSQINDLMMQKLSLEHSLVVMEEPHAKAMKRLQMHSEKRREIVRHMARHFIMMQEFRAKPNSP